MQKDLLCIAIAAVAVVAASNASPTHSLAAHVSARPSITVRVDDSRITSPPRMPAGLVDIHIVTSGKVHHHLAFWHLNPGVTVKRFTRALQSPKGPFDLGTAIGGNGPMLAGHLDTTMRLLPGTVAFADIVDGPTTRIASFQVTGTPCPPSRLRPSEPSTTGASGSCSRRALVDRASIASRTAILWRTTGRSTRSSEARPRPISSAGSGVAGRGARLPTSRGLWADRA
jgi:hypothetical protein